ncbi:MAG TPA: hypothetical protein VLB68_18720 [Pyrinomonadaceae bacterium]|nr:hypothetical protein [Pyrinomonadaceae bacterium]
MRDQIAAGYILLRPNTPSRGFASKVDWNGIEFSCSVRVTRVDRFFCSANQDDPEVTRINYEPKCFRIEPDTTYEAKRHRAIFLTQRLELS